MQLALYRAVYGPCPPQAVLGPAFYAGLNSNAPSTRFSQCPPPPAAGTGKNGGENGGYRANPC